MSHQVLNTGLTDSWYQRVIVCEVITQCTIGKYLTHDHIRSILAIDRFCLTVQLTVL